MGSSATSTAAARWCGGKNNGGFLPVLSGKDESGQEMKALHHRELNKTEQKEKPVFQSRESRFLHSVRRFRSDGPFLAQEAGGQGAGAAVGADHRADDLDADVPPVVAANLRMKSIFI